MATINLQKDFLDFLELCNKHGVRYFIIGGYAVSFHGYPRATKDIDIWVESKEENAKKLILVIDDFGFKSLQLVKEDFLNSDGVVQLGVEPNRIDIMLEMEVVDFEMAWERRCVETIDEVEVNFIGLEDLLVLKKNAGRPQDLADLSKLIKRKR